MSMFDIKIHLQLSGLLALSLAWVPLLILSYTVIYYAIMINPLADRVWLIIVTFAATTFLVKPVVECIKLNYEVLHFWFNQEDYL